MRDTTLADRAIFVLMFMSLAAVIGYAFLGLEEAFADVFAAEDGLIEYGTAIFLFICSVVLARYALRLLGAGRRFSGACVALYALIFLFGAGEEISWGQRIIGFETPPALREANVQGEVTLHNLAWGDSHIAHTIFGTGLSAVILLYLVVLPFLYPRVRWIAWLADAFMVPVPSPRHAVGTIVASLVMVAVDISRQWEVYEFVFGLLMLSVILAPLNARRFDVGEPATV